MSDREKLLEIVNKTRGSSIASVALILLKHIESHNVKIEKGLVNEVPKVIGVDMAKPGCGDRTAISLLYANADVLCVEDCRTIEMCKQCGKPIHKADTPDIFVRCECDALSAERLTTPAWTPEVGKLYKSINGKMWEYTSELTMTDMDGYSIKYDSIERMFHQLGYTPIAELEGLKEGDKVYSYSSITEVCDWSVLSILDGCYTLTSGMHCVQVSADGYVLKFTPHQLFWRTADRAKRYGQGGEA